MNENPTNQIKDLMWHFMMDKGQRENIPALKGYVYDLISLTTRKHGAYERKRNTRNVNWNDMDMIIWSIVIEATALVLSGRLDELEKRVEEDDN